ncbi:energy transducer TonB [Hydrogenophaga sp.]|uniref:energy transducer TonB n=1 Tax=Hydrogenophaga sp. TaxID=1904254 RepID=UPI0035B00C64
MLSTHATATVPQDGFGPVTPSARMNRRLLIVAAVIGLHIAGLWALQTGLLRRAVELVVPVQVIADLIELPQPKVEPTPSPPAPQPTPKPQPVVRQTPRPQPTPLPVTVADPAPSDHAPIVPAPVPPAPAEPSPAPARPVEPAVPAVQLPSSTADYLNNPAPAYPPLSRRLGEQGRVVVRVLIGTDGTASQAEIRSSSGFERLDQAALQTVLKWRYVPGKRAGVPEAMWFNVPINFVLE